MGEGGEGTKTNILQSITEYELEIIKDFIKAVKENKTIKFVLIFP